MKKIIFFTLAFIAFSCEKASESSLELYVDPLIVSYKKNNVAFYLKLVSGKDTIYTIDSVCLNRNGLVTLQKVKKGYINETSYEYDSLNRIIKTKHYSDTYYNSKMEYEFDKKTKNLIGFIYSYNSNTKSFNKKLEAFVIYKFRNGKLVEESLIDEKSKDTVMKKLYRYNSRNKIYEISKKNIIDDFEVKTEYKYRKNNTLYKIIEDTEEKYISEESGLIDSVKQRFTNKKITYQYFFREK